MPSIWDYMLVGAATTNTNYHYVNSEVQAWNAVGEARASYNSKINSANAEITNLRESLRDAQSINKEWREGYEQLQNHFDTEQEKSQFFYDKLQSTMKENEKLSAQIASLSQEKLDLALEKEKIIKEAAEIMLQHLTLKNHLIQQEIDKMLKADPELLDEVIDDLEKAQS